MRSEVDQAAPAPSSLLAATSRLSNGLRNKDFAVLAALVAVASFVPIGSDGYFIRVATTMAMYVALAQAWNLMGGYAGLISLAHPAFFGTGAVAAAVFLINGFSVAIAIVGSLALSMIVALAMAVPTLRLQGHYFVVATLLVAEALRGLVLNFNAFNFHGGVAVNIIGPVGLAVQGPEEYNAIFYYLMLALAAASMVLVIALDRSRWGYALRAIRDSQTAASALGIAATKLKIITFLVSAAMTSVIGTVWAFWLGTVETNEAYNLIITFEVIVMVFLGGKGTVWGPPVGVVLVLLLNELIGVEFAELTQIVSGLIVVLIVLFQPDGLITVARDGPGAFSPRRLYSNLLRYRVT